MHRVQKINNEKMYSVASRLTALPYTQRHAARGTLRGTEMAKGVTLSS